MRLTLCCAIVCCSAPLAGGVAQQVSGITRAQAAAAAFLRSPRLAASRADTAAANARVASARAVPNPVLSASYSKSVPQFHVTAEMPVDELWLREIRIRAAQADRISSLYSGQYELAAVALDVDTTYTRALAAQAHARLSERNAQDADSLRRIAMTRRTAGDASDLEVELATLTAGQQANIAAADSLMVSASLLELQAIIGVATDRITITLADSLSVPPAFAEGSGAGVPLLVAGAAAALEAATLNAKLQHRSAWGSPGLLVGFETGDPTGAEPGLLPTVGISLPLPVFNRNRGPVAEAEAQRARAAAQLDIAQVESRVQVSRVRGGMLAAASRLSRDRQLLQSAQRVAAMSLIAYREGAAPLSGVLEAQRAARDVQSQYIDDMANALVATATFRLLTLTPDSVSQP